MGSPLTPVLANIFIDFYKSKWLNEYNLNKRKFKSLFFFNYRHPNIKFAIEKKISHSVTLLDVFISGINNQNLTLYTFRKSNYTRLVLNFKCFTSFSYKISLIK